MSERERWSVVGTINPEKCSVRRKWGVAVLFKHDLVTFSKQKSMTLNTYILGYVNTKSSDVKDRSRFAPVSITFQEFGNIPEKSAKV